MIVAQVLTLANPQDCYSDLTADHTFWHFLRRINVTSSDYSSPDLTSGKVKNSRISLKKLQYSARRVANLC